MLVVESYISIFYDKPMEPYHEATQRVLKGIDLKNCIVNPNLAAPLLKLIIDGLQYFKNHIQPQ